MKHLFLVLCIAPLYTIGTISAMDGILLPTMHQGKEDVTDEVSDEDLHILSQQFASFNQNIEDTYYGNMYNWISNGTVSETEAFGFIEAFSTRFPSAAARIKLLNHVLHGDTDTFFGKIINYFIELAQKNFDNVTCDTLGIIQDAHAQQPTPQLNQLPLDIKAYVMNQAYNTIEHTYDIILSGHTAKITSIDIHADIDRAATASRDGTFRLWDLTTGKRIHTFPEKACNGYVRFNNAGSQLATATATTTQSIDIKIWNLLSTQLLYTIKQEKSIRGLSFLQHKTHGTLIIFQKTDSHLESTRMLLYRLKKNEKPIFLGDTNSGPVIKGFPYTNMGNYKGTKQDVDWSGNVTLKIEKNTRPLFLYERALQNTDDISSLRLLQQTPLYDSLTKYEKKYVTSQH